MTDFLTRYREGILWSAATTINCDDPLVVEVLDSRLVNVGNEDQAQGDGGASVLNRCVLRFFVAKQCRIWPATMPFLSI